MPTVGYGHECKSKSCSEVPFKFPLTKANAEALLVQDLRKFADCLNSYINNKVKLNDNQWAALVRNHFSISSSIFILRYR